MNEWISIYSKGSWFILTMSRFRSSDAITVWRSWWNWALSRLRSNDAVTFWRIWFNGTLSRFRPSDARTVWRNWCNWTLSRFWSSDARAVWRIWFNGTLPRFRPSELLINVQKTIRDIEWMLAGGSNIIQAPITNYFRPANGSNSSEMWLFRFKLS